MYLAVVAERDPTVDVPADLPARVTALLAQGKVADAGALIQGELLARPERGPRCRPARNPGPSAARPL